MSSTTRLLVLGVVKLFQPVHGYEVRRELLSWRAQEWASVQPGSIYNALKTLCRDGLVEIASTDQVGGRPERTTYRLTAAGDEEFHTLLREEWWTVRPPIDPLMAAVSFLGDIARPEAIAALEHRATVIRGMVRQLEFAIEGHDGSDSPPHVREMMRLMNARVSSELAWSEQFLARLRRNEYATAGDPPWQPPRRAPDDGPRGTSLGLRGEPAPSPTPRGRKPRGGLRNGAPDAAASSTPLPRARRGWRDRTPSNGQATRSEPARSPSTRSDVSERGRRGWRDRTPNNGQATRSEPTRSPSTRSDVSERGRRGWRDRTPNDGQGTRSEGWRRARDGWRDRQPDAGNRPSERTSGERASSTTERAGSRRRRRASR